MKFEKNIQLAELIGELVDAEGPWLERAAAFRQACEQSGNGQALEEFVSWFPADEAEDETAEEEDGDIEGTGDEPTQ